MQLLTDNRGVSEVIGAVLVFGLLISLMAIMQTYAVPAANAEVEFDHNQKVQGDLAKFHERASRVALSGDGESVSIETGTGYPTRMLFFNPPRVTGTTSTSENRKAKISNVKATDSEVADYLDGSNTLELDSRTFEYRVNYNELDDSPTTKYEYGILYNQHRNSTINQNPGSVIDDTDINLVFMAGNYSRSTGSAQSLDIRPVSAPARPVTVEGQNGDNITLVLPTDMPVEEWRELYGNQDTVLGISEVEDSDAVQIDLDGDKRYTLRMAALGLEQGVEKPNAHYIVPADDGVTTVGASDAAIVKYEVRDEYNNPVSGVDVEITLPNGTVVTEQTDGNGRVTHPVSPGNPTLVTGEISGCSPGDRCEADFRVQVANLNPNPSSGVTLTAADNDDVLGLLSSANAHMEFTSSAESRSMNKIRFNHYHPDPNGHTPVNMTDGNFVISAEIGGAFVDVPDDFEDITTNGTFYDLEFDGNVESDDYWIVTIIFENGERALYFASPK
jgi:hypothetical protein